jgi:hypothetical protein
MSTKDQIKEHIQTRLGRFLEKTIIVNDIGLFDVKQINEGVLTVWPEWSPQGVINCMRTIQYLYDQNYQGSSYVIDIDDIITAESQINLFGHVLHGWGEVFMVKQGVITEEFLGKESFAQFKARYEPI